MTPRRKKKDEVPHPDTEKLTEYKKVANFTNQRDLNSIYTLRWGSLMVLMYPEQTK